MDEQIYQSGRRVATTLPPGSPLVAAVDALCSRHGATQATVRLQGALRQVRVSLGDDAPPLELAGPVQVVSAEGALAPDLGVTGFMAVLAWSDQGLPRVVAGQLEQAVSAGVRVTIEIWEEVERSVVERRPARPAAGPVEPAPPRAAELRETKAPPPASGAKPVVRPTPPAETAAAPPTAAPPPVAGGGGWAAAVAASKAPPPSAARAATGLTPSGAGPLDEDPEAKPGDVLVHPQFGRCKVMSHPENERVKIRMATGRFVDLHLGYVRLIRQADEEGVRIFRVQPSKR